MSLRACRSSRKVISSAINSAARASAFLRWAGLNPFIQSFSVIGMARQRSEFGIEVLMEFNFPLHSYNMVYSPYVVKNILRGARRSPFLRACTSLQRASAPGKRVYRPTSISARRSCHSGKFPVRVVFSTALTISLDSNGPRFGAAKEKRYNGGWPGRASVACRVT